MSNTTPQPVQIISKRLTLYEYLKHREVLFDVRSNSLAFYPRLTWSELDELFGPGRDHYPWFKTGHRASPSFGHVTDIDHFFPTNGKMIAPTWSIAPGPMQYGGTCPAADAMFKYRSIPYIGEKGRFEAAKITDRQAANKVRLIGEAGDPADWVCNDCYALKGQYYFSSKIVKWIAVQLWIERTGMSQFAVNFIDMIRFNKERLLLVLDKKDVTPESLAEGSVAHPNYFRVHDAGDFFSPVYYQAWCEIAAGCPDINFWAATRVWALPSLARKFASVTKPKNFIVRPSELFKGKPPAKHAWPDAAATAVAWSKRQIGKGLKPDMKVRGAIECPVASAPGSTCQNSGGRVRYRGRPPRGCAWPSGCRACWDSPNTPIIYREH